ncbi:MAG TPA: flap endonuclease Xni, partial [Pantoea agglomerans]|nr:flap endonuclease Xni [Pantoea agglomerans]
TEFHTLEGIYQQLDQVPARWREKLAEGQQMAEISRQVATLKRDLALQGNLNTLRYTG